MFPYTDSAKSEVDMFPRTDVLKWHSFCPLKPRGDCGVDTTNKFVEILCFKHFVKHFVFNEYGDKYRNKSLKDYITVSVVVDMGCGNTRK